MEDEKFGKERKILALEYTPFSLVDKVNSYISGLGNACFIHKAIIVNFDDTKQTQTTLGEMLCDMQNNCSNLPNFLVFEKNDEQNNEYIQESIKNYLSTILITKNDNAINIKKPNFLEFETNEGQNNEYMQENIKNYLSTILITKNDNARNIKKINVQIKNNRSFYITFPPNWEFKINEKDRREYLIVEENGWPIVYTGMQQHMETYLKSIFNPTKSSSISYDVIQFNLEYKIIDRKNIDLHYKNLVQGLKNVISKYSNLIISVNPPREKLLSEDKGKVINKLNVSIQTLMDTEFTVRFASELQELERNSYKYKLDEQKISLKNRAQFFEINIFNDIERELMLKFEVIKYDKFFYSKKFYTDEDYEKLTQFLSKHLENYIVLEQTSKYRFGSLTIGKFLSIKNTLAKRGHRVFYDLQNRFIVIRKNIAALAKKIIDTETEDSNVTIYCLDTCDENKNSKIMYKDVKNNERKKVNICMDCLNTSLKNFVRDCNIQEQDKKISPYMASKIMRKFNDFEELDIQPDWIALYLNLLFNKQSSEVASAYLAIGIFRALQDAGSICYCDIHQSVTRKKPGTAFVCNKDPNCVGFSTEKLNGNIKQCPNCFKFIERIDGCNHITCTTCGCHFCWICFFKADNGKSVYAHMSSIHGGFFTRQ